MTNSVNQLGVNSGLMAAGTNINQSQVNLLVTLAGDAIAREYQEKFGS